LKRFLSAKKRPGSVFFVLVSLSLAFFVYNCTILSLSGMPYLAIQHLIRTYLWTLVQNCGLARFSGANLCWALGWVILQFLAHFQLWGDKAGPTQVEAHFYF